MENLKELIDGQNQSYDLYFYKDVDGKPEYYKFEIDNLYDIIYPFLQQIENDLIREYAEVNENIACIDKNNELIRQKYFDLTEKIRAPIVSLENINANPATFKGYCIVVKQNNTPTAYLFKNSAPYFNYKRSKTKILFSFDEHGKLRLYGKDLFKISSEVDYIITNTYFYLMNFKLEEDLGLTQKFSERRKEILQEIHESGMIEDLGQFDKFTKRYKKPMRDYDKRVIEIYRSDKARFINDAQKHGIIFDGDKPTVRTKEEGLKLYEYICCKAIHNTLFDIYGTADNVKLND